MGQAWYLIRFDIINKEGIMMAGTLTVVGLVTLLTLYLTLSTNIKNKA